MSIRVSRCKRDVSGTDKTSRYNFVPKLLEVTAKM